MKVLSNLIVPGSQEYIAKAARIIRDGGLVAFPTETVYGLGANALDDAAVAKIFKAKGRPSNNPLITHLHSLDQLSLIADLDSSRITDWISKLSHLFPGPISLVLPAKELVSKNVRAGGNTVAVRFPKHPIAQALLIETNLPIAAPSANRSSELSPTTAEHVAKGLGPVVDLIIDGGTCDVGLESTVLSLVNPQPVLLRPGAITLEELQALLGPIEIADKFSETAVLPSPGLLRKHYAPKTPLRLRRQVRLDKIPRPAAFISFSREVTREIGCNFDHTVELSGDGDLRTISRKLFSTLHSLDQLKFSLIVVDECTNQGLGRAILDRLSRAAAF